MEPGGSLLFLEGSSYLRDNIYMVEKINHFEFSNSGMPWSGTTGKYKTNHNDYNGLL